MLFGLKYGRREEMIPRNRRISQAGAHVHVCNELTPNVLEDTHYPFILELTDRCAFTLTTKLTPADINTGDVTFSQFTLSHRVQKVVPTISALPKFHSTVPLLGGNSVPIFRILHLLLRQLHQIPSEHSPQ